LHRRVVADQNIMDSWLESFATAGFRRSSDTAHDLKTPLNVAVLNLELLRMRMRKLAQGADDEKALAYARSIELELRRMAQIFDAFFILSTPPKGEGDPSDIDVCALCTDVASSAGVAIDAAAAINVVAHESRIREALKLFFDGATRLLRADERVATVNSNGHFLLTVTGKPEPEDLEIAKIFKFYFTDAQGNPDLSLAAARLIVETYGGELIASQDRDKVSLQLSLPSGAYEKSSDR
jgi:nitrogen fixation/metabolism regulation signal transduction histidine kinase